MMGRDDRRSVSFHLFVRHTDFHFRRNAGEPRHEDILRFFDDDLTTLAAGDTTEDEQISKVTEYCLMGNRVVEANADDFINRPRTRVERRDLAQMSRRIMVELFRGKNPARLDFRRAVCSEHARP